MVKQWQGVGASRQHGSPPVYAPVLEHSVCMHATKHEQYYMADNSISGVHYLDTVTLEP